MLWFYAPKGPTFLLTCNANISHHLPRLLGHLDPPGMRKKDAMSRATGRGGSPEGLATEAARGKAWSGERNCKAKSKKKSNSKLVQLVLVRLVLVAAHHHDDK